MRGPSRRAGRVRDMAKAKGTMSPIERAQAALEEAERLNLGGDQDVPAEDSGAEEVAPEEAQQPEVPVEPKPVAKADDDPNSETFKQRWLSQQGMLRSHQQKVEQLIEQNKLLSQQIQAMQAAPSPNTLSNNVTAEDLQVHVSNLATEFGEDFTTALQQVVRGELSNAFAQRLAPMEQKVETVARDGEELRRARFAQELDGAAPAWRKINGTPEWNHWLDTSVEGMSGKTYRELFDDANNGWDLGRIAMFFNHYSQTNGMDAAPAAAPVDPRTGLVAPGRGAAAPSVPPDKGGQKVWSNRDIEAFYAAVRRGEYVGKEAEQARIEADMFEANRSGRLR